MKTDLPKFGYEVTICDLQAGGRTVTATVPVEKLDDLHDAILDALVAVGFTPDSVDDYREQYSRDISHLSGAGPD